MAEQVYPREFVGLLPAETARWVQEGVISEAQRGAILQLYPAPAASGRDRTILIFSILGSVLVGCGVLLFFAANWPVIPALVKVAAIMAAVVGAYWGGYHMQFVRGDYPVLGHSLIFLGSLLYGAAIWLVAQIFHLESHYPTGYLLWGLGVLPVAWMATSKPILYLATVGLTIWTVMEQGAFHSFNYAYPVVLLALLVPLARRLRAGLAEAGALAGLFLWFTINIAVGMQVRGPTSSHDTAMLLFPLLILYGAALIGLGQARLGDARVYLGTGSLATLMGFYFLTFRWENWQDYAPESFYRLVSHSPYPLIGLALLLGAVGWSAWQGWSRAEEGRLLVWAAVLPSVVVALSAGLMGDILRMVVFNLLLFAGAIGMIALGINRREGLLLNLGLGAFCIHLLTRYVDLFFSAMDRALFFIVGGALLLGGGWLLERNRRRWMSGLGGGGHAE